MKKTHKIFRNSILGFLTGVTVLVGGLPYVNTAMAITSQPSATQDYIPWYEGEPAFRITEINPTEETFTFQINRKVVDFAGLRSMVLYYPTWAKSVPDPTDLVNLAPIYEWAQILSYIQAESDSIIYREIVEGSVVEEYKVKSLLPIASTTGGAWLTEVKPYDLYISVGISERAHWGGVVSFADCMANWQYGMTCKMDDEYIETESHQYYATYHAEVIPETPETPSDEEPSSEEEEEPFDDNDAEGEKTPNTDDNSLSQVPDKTPEKETLKVLNDEARPRETEVRYIRDFSNVGIVADNTSAKEENASEDGNLNVKFEDVDVPALGDSKTVETGVRYEILWILVILAFIAGGLTMFLLVYLRKRYSKDD